MSGSFRGHDAQTVTTFTFQPVHQTPRFFVSELGCFTTAVTEHSPILILKIAGHKKAGGKGKREGVKLRLRNSYPFPL